MEPILVPLIVFGFAALIVKMSLDYSKWKKMHESTGSILAEGSDKSLAVSELREMIQDAVETANAPLLERVAHLEDRFESGTSLIEERASPRQLPPSDG